MVALNRIGIVFALKKERSGLERVFTEARVTARYDKNMVRWSIGETEILGSVSGIGANRARQTTRLLIDCGAKTIFCAGFAAGLNPELRAGDVLVAKRVIRKTSTDFEAIECDAIVLTQPINAGYLVRTGNLVTWDDVVCMPSQKRQIRDKTRADALDMESYSVGQVCRERGVLFAAVRVISDTADDELPEIAELLARTQNTLAKLILAIPRPKHWSSLTKLRKQSALASRNLGNYLGLALLRTNREEQSHP
ncbi:MAG: hypothetical protein N3B12_01770 [Armatimonadetes bacterium]|nr:hypothetical protein [Armatimonadota bacterium]